MDEMKKQVSDLRESLLKKNVIINEKDLLYKSLKFNVFIGTIISFIIIMCLSFIIK